ncbi:iron-sulfur cluster carrier protein [Comamonadaceae bacterium OS-1]|nr:iron-sulfur cluster carrier protein [Comamonadaceae bacterium OS-1]
MKQCEIIAITSGKGGVGKTTLAIGLAQIISTSGSPVLLIDLDFLNRGLSELIGDHGECLPNKKFTEFNDDRLHILNEFSKIQKISDNIYCLIAPQIDITGIHQLENVSPEEIFEAISAIINKSILDCNARVAIIDCHGSADSISRTAVAIAKNILIVCIPELITFFGTRQLINSFTSVQEIEKSNERKFHLIFNRVGQGFTTTLLTHWSRKYLGETFKNNPPIAVIPADDTISIASLDELLPTKQAMYSSAVEKIRILTATLFKSHSTDLLSPETKFVNKFFKFIYTPRSVPFSGFLNALIPMRTLMMTTGIIVAAALLNIAFPILTTLIQHYIDIRIEDVVATVGATYSIFLALAFWGVLAYVTNSLLECDSELSGILSTGLRSKKLFRIIFCILVIIIGTVFLTLLTFEDGAAENDLLHLAPLLGGIMPKEAYIALMKWLFLAFSTITWSARFYLLLFSLVFILRSIRTILFRPKSPEMAIRLFLIIILAWLLNQ